MSIQSRKVYTHILNNAQCSEVEKIASLITKDEKVVMIKPPQKTLTMVKMREPVGKSLFYLGEILCTECMVEIGCTKGFAVCMGDDFEKAKACAIIDAAISANIAQSKMIIAEIVKIGVKQSAERRKLNGEIVKSRVDFQTMSEN